MIMATWNFLKTVSNICQILPCKMEKFHLVVKGGKYRSKALFFCGKNFLQNAISLSI